MKKSTAIGIAAVSAAGVVALSLGAVSDWYKNWDTKTWFNYWGKGAPTVEEPVTPDGQSDLGLSVIPQTSEVMRLFVGRSSFLSETSVTVTAVLTPTNDDLKLDWSIEHLDGLPATEVTVTPESDGAKTATVECVSAFDEELVLKVTVRGVGSFATASVKFIGKPTSLTTTSTQMSKSGDAYLASGVADYAVNLVLSNKWNSVGSAYGNYEITSTEYVGTVRIKHTAYGSTGRPSSTNTSDDSFSVYAADYFEFSINGNSLSVKCKGSIVNYSIMVDTPVVRTSTMTDEDKPLVRAPVNPFANKHEYAFDSIVETCLCKITVKDTVSGLSTVVNVGWDSAMLTTIALDTGEITF